MFSDGFENLFHHPHPDVISFAWLHRAEVRRTDLQGLIGIRPGTRATALRLGDRMAALPGR